MSFKLKFNFKIYNKTNSYLKDLKIVDEEGLLHNPTLNKLDKKNFNNLQEVYMHLYKPEKIYLKFSDEHGIERKLLIFKNIKEILKLNYEIIIEKDEKENYNAKVA
ncbi:hypothetical protein [Clostridium thermobutyricum]|uniref:Uncharacterized protein n=1 Tax=Clostridium thermobutyricum DSM 4928 TaxID=1121339 RepID=A0A1V4SW41_9CLOT|nr:hypothetical protein [Clostridium thermobutyricum]OPX47755.1 hypothetical protein CLTHE_16660 [Clostridium thermobutyricum DSM 4928]